MYEVSFGNEDWKFRPLNTVQLKVLTPASKILVTDCDISLRPIAQVMDVESDPVAGSYAGSTDVSLSTETDGATIYYTTDGSTPSSLSTKYSSAINISSTTTIKAIGIKTGLLDSNVYSGEFVIT